MPRDWGKETVANLPNEVRRYKQLMAKARLNNKRAPEWREAVAFLRDLYSKFGQKAVRKEIEK